MSRIQCRQLHSDIFGRRHNTLQSRGLFELAKPLYSSCTAANSYWVHWYDRRLCSWFLVKLESLLCSQSM